MQLSHSTAATAQPLGDPLFEAFLPLQQEEVNRVLPHPRQVLGSVIMWQQHLLLPEFEVDPIQ